MLEAQLQTVAAESKKSSTIKVMLRSVTRSIDLIGITYYHDWTELIFGGLMADCNEFSLISDDYRLDRAVCAVSFCRQRLQRRVGLVVQPERLSHCKTAHLFPAKRQAGQIEKSCRR